MKFSLKIKNDHDIFAKIDFIGIVFLVMKTKKKYSIYAYKNTCWETCWLNIDRRKKQKVLTPYQMF